MSYCPRSGGEPGSVRLKERSAIGEQGRRPWVVAALAVAAVVLGLFVPGPGTPPAAALSGSQFNPGHIISDGVFYNQGAMTEAQVQAFLNQKVPACRSGYTCLKDYRENTWSRSADSRCGAYSGGNQSAATIIYNVSQACGINPQVLITLLEKEQGLVSDSWPSARQYRSATGYGCPDTADCDSAYYGFYNQVYNAAHQFKAYQANPNNWSYRAGRNNTILWHPNAACGTSTVFIENQATAALYIYTPYRPNDAALANLYGTGDACSSYGNRNFWRIFSDWFGSTIGDSDLVKAPDSPEIYLVVGQSKVLVPSPAALESLRPLFPYRTVARSYLDSLAAGGTFNGLVRDPLTGEISLVDRGIKHRFPTCDLVSTMGYSCGVTTALLPSQLAKIPTGADIGPFVKSAASPLVYFLDGQVKRTVATWSIVTALNGRVSPHVMTVSESRLSSWVSGPAVLAPGSLVKAASSPQIYMIDGTAARIPVSSFDTAGELGIVGWTQQPDNLLAAYPATGGVLSSILQCGSSTFIGGSGILTGLTQAAESGLPITVASPLTCSALPNSGQTQDGPLFVKTASNPTIFMVTAGSARPVDSMETLIALNRNQNPVLVTMGLGALAAIPKGADLLRPGALVKAPGSPQIYMVDGLSSLVPVGSFDIAAELGATGYSTQSDARLASYAKGTAPLRVVLRCASGQFLIGGQGRTWRLGDANGFGLQATLVDELTCSVLPPSPVVIPGAFFVKDPSVPTVYLLRDGQKQPVSSWDRLIVLNGGSQPTIVPVTTAPLATIPTGPSA